jgi:hypothetical protein
MNYVKHRLLKLLRIFNYGNPTRYEVANVLANTQMPMGKSLRIYASEYVDGESFSEIAVFHGVNSERVRQCVLKVCCKADNLSVDKWF